MKVCTDACLFGAWSAEQINNSKKQITNALDIGCGTGLLSLMFAQKNLNAIIDAVEIDEAASAQTKKNFYNSYWKNRLNIFNDSIQNFASTINKKYDVIICNPPFYEHDLKSLNKQRNLALHSDALSLEELMFIVKKILKEDGVFFVLLPYHRTNYFENLLIKHNLFRKEKVLIKQTPEHNYFRTMFYIDRKATALSQTELIIKNATEYSKPFKDLLKDFYLNIS